MRVTPSSLLEEQLQVREQGWRFLQPFFQWFVIRDRVLSMDTSHPTSTMYHYDKGENAETGTGMKD